MLLTTFLSAAFLFGGPTPVLARQTSDTTAEGIEILRRILCDTLDEAFADEKKDQASRFNFRAQPELHGLVTTLWAGSSTVSHSRAFHVPGLGVFLSLDLALPVVAAAPDEAPQARTPAKDDEWERVQREVRARVSADGTPTWLSTRLLGAPEDMQIDPRAVDQVTEELLGALARHAARIEGLAAGDSITVALHLSGKCRTLFSRSESEGDPEDEEASAFVLGFEGGSEAPEQRLVLRISLADLAGQGDKSLARLAERAEINRY